MFSKQMLVGFRTKHDNGVIPESKILKLGGALLEKQSKFHEM